MIACGQNDESFSNSQNFVSDNPLEEFPEINEDDLERIGQLGYGYGSVVFKVKHKTLNKIMAEKRILPEKNDVHTLKEFRVLQRCKSPHIVGFYGAFYGERPIHGERDISICMEFMDGLSLNVLVEKVGRISEPVLGKTTVAVLNGMNYLKSEFGILHREIKPSSILVNTKGDIKLGGFGFGIPIWCTFTGDNRVYEAPERIKGIDHNAHNVQSDIWSLGFSLVELAIGRYPIPYPTVEEYAKIFGKNVDEVSLYSSCSTNGENKQPVHNNHIVGLSPSVQIKGLETMCAFELLSFIVEEPPPSLPRGVFSEEFLDFVDKCLKKTPQERATLQMLLNHAFIGKSSRENVDVAGWVRETLKND